MQTSQRKQSLPGSRMLCECSCRRHSALERSCRLLHLVIQSPDVLCRRQCLACKHCESLIKLGDAHVHVCARVPVNKS